MPKCIVQISYDRVINLVTLLKRQRQKIINNYQVTSRLNTTHITKHSHPYYRLLTYNDHLLRNHFTPSIPLPLLTPTSPNVPRTENNRLIFTLITHVNVCTKLNHISSLLQNFDFLEFYTDGSLK
jgi:hypothetical protein